MDLNITVLGSGSSGNSILITYGDNGILIDSGFSRKELFSRLDKVGISPEVIQSLLITHEHSDHVKGARIVADTLDIPTYATRGTAECMLDKNYLGKKRTLFDSGSPFLINDFKIRPFRISHDAIDPVGFIIQVKNIRIGIAMDLGHLDQLVKCRLSGCDAIILESNHDHRLLKNSNRPLRLIRRIAGRLGHLDNNTAINSLDEILNINSKFLMLGHISNECNDRELIHELASLKLKKLNRKDVKLSLLKQNEPHSTLCIG